MRDPIRPVRVADELWHEARAKAELEGVSLSALMREALEAYCAAPPADMPEDDNPTTWSGYRAHTRRAVLVNGAEAGLDTDGGGWSTICRVHDTVIAHETRKVASEFLYHPGQWCEACAE
jgi:hypothetical protein